MENQEFSFICHKIMEENFNENQKFVRIGISKITIQFGEEEEKILSDLPLFRQKIKDASKPFCLWLPSPTSFLFFHTRLAIKI